MKNMLKYYYNLEVDDIRVNNKSFKIVSNNTIYILLPYERKKADINELFMIQSIFSNRRINCSQIIPNISRNLITNINNEDYVLIMVNNNDELISLDDILNFPSYIYNEKGLENLKRDNWGLMWAKKIDYIEYQFSQFKNDYSLLKESFNYVIGLAENGIQLINSVSKENEGLIICHNRVKYNTTYFDLYNPLEFVIDYKIRDTAEYFKSYFFYQENDFDTIKDYLSNGKLTVNECLLFFARMFFVTPYFDLYEDIVLNIIPEEKIKIIINKLNDYECLLQKIYLFLKKYINFSEIEWLKKANH